MRLAWSIEFDDTRQLVELSFEGPVSGPELLQAAAARIDFGRAKGAARYLIDAAAMLASPSVVIDVLEIPSKVYFEKKMDRAHRIAVVEPLDPDSRWISEFYENASFNRGWQVRSFADRGGAVAWLLSHPAG